MLALACAGSAVAAVTTLDPAGTVVLNGAPVFPIVLAKGPPRDGTTPTGTNAMAEVVGAGVNFFKVGPATTTWTSSDITDANLWDQAAVAHGAYTWINLSTLSQATPGSSIDSLLQQVITTLKSDPSGSAGIGMWKGADEPFWSGIQPTGLQFAFCRSTSRGDASWCGGEPWLDQDHLWVTVEAPRGTATDLAPFSPVTDSHGEDEYPVNVNNPSPDLHQVGVWTSTIGAATPNHAVWSTIQICSSGSYDSSGNFVLPTRLQERYMIYDAIVNGARSLAFYGGNNPNCWNSSDTASGWNWTFWNGVLKGLIQEINAGSGIAPALVQVVVAGPTLKKLTPPPTTSDSASAPDGVVPPRGGPFARTIGRERTPPTRTVPFGSVVVTPAAATSAQTSATSRPASQTSLFTASPSEAAQTL